MKHALFLFLFIISDNLFASNRFDSFDSLVSYHSETWFSWDQLQYCFNVVVATILGAVIGWGHRKPRINVGPSTFAAVSLGTSLGASLLLHLYNFYHVTNVFSAVSGFASGIGFIAGAVILKINDKGVFGLTSAASLWATAIIGLSTGMEFYTIAIFTTIFVFIFLHLNRQIDE